MRRGHVHQHSPVVIPIRVWHIAHQPAGAGANDLVRVENDTLGAEAHEASVGPRRHVQQIAQRVGEVLLGPS